MFNFNDTGQLYTFAVEAGDGEPSQGMFIGTGFQFLLHQRHHLAHEAGRHLALVARLPGADGFARLGQLGGETGALLLEAREFLLELDDPLVPLHHLALGELGAEAVGIGTGRQHQDQRQHPFGDAPPEAAPAALAVFVKSQ